MRQSICTSSMHIRIETGSEGPVWDPYAYTEYTVEFTGDRYGQKCVKLHMGLGEWLEIGNHRHKGDENLIDVFADLTGFKPYQLEKWMNKARSRCRKCGGRQGVWHAGYPGESFLICVKCGEHMDYIFHESEII